MSFQYHEISAVDAQWVRPILMAANRASCEYAFANLFMWSQVYHEKIAQYDGLVIVRYESPQQEEGSPYSYLFPVGTGSQKAAIEEMIQESQAAARPIQIFSISEADKNWMEENFPDTFDFVVSRDEADYVYESSALQTLAGKKLQKKRNLVSRFLRENPDYTTELIDENNLQEVMEFNHKWAYLCDNRDDEGIMTEHRAVCHVLRHYKELGLQGCLIRIKGEIVAFSYGSPISDQMLDTHVEKALYTVTGAYNMINREFALRFGGAYRYINREDDVGSEGLRKAKLSYHPAFLEQKYIATLKGTKTKWFI